jgi:hypothetical protein
MSCAQIERYLSAYVDDELAGVEKLRVRAHLRQCQACSRQLESIVAMKRALRALPTQEPDEAFVDRLSAAVRHAPPPNMWDSMRRSISDPLARTLGTATEAFKYNRVRWAGLGVVPLLLGALVLAHFMLITGPGVRNVADTSGLQSPAEFVSMTSEPAGMDTVMPILGPVGPMANPDFQLAVDQSMRRHFAHAATVQPVAYDGRQ